MSPALQADSLPAELQGKPKNTGVGSLSLLQGIFLTQEWTGVSCIAGGFFTNWAIREAQLNQRKVLIVNFHLQYGGIIWVNLTVKIISSNLIKSELLLACRNGYSIKVGCISGQRKAWNIMYERFMLKKKDSCCLVRQNEASYSFSCFLTFISFMDWHMVLENTLIRKVLG